MPAFEIAQTIRTFGGKLLKLSHKSAELGGLETKLNLYLPPQAEKGKVPVLFYLSGLTCTGDNCAEKGNFINPASKEGLALVFPDTSPRGAGAPNEEDSWDFGTGAGFYIDATSDAYAKHYRMYSYVTKELPELLFKEFGKELDESKVGITGHSMGGHGALTLFLRNPGKYKSVSAFSPIVNPINCQWGQKAFSGYFGAENKSKWSEHDATELISSLGDKAASLPEILIDQGLADNFYPDQLLTKNFEKAAKEAGVKANVRYQDGYDHSYFFISTFAEEHVKHHAKYLKA
ncbi:S-formylglutathione hydrol [Saitoella complicata NRRL Y-17804]|nr:S-formylglutathione hydrol [Saitoella complicata NRRL Y-17804]ODQ51373.1 S-formylglutathione hydrol [Saitoella complicata NRRL Y-17804]